MPVGVDAAPAAEVVLQKEPATLEIPTLGLIRPLLLPQPEVDESLLRQVLLQRAINRQPENNLSHRRPSFALIDQHDSSLREPLFKLD